MKYGLILVGAAPGLLKTIALSSVQQCKRSTAFFLMYHLYWATRWDFVCRCEGKQRVVLNLWDKNDAYTEFHLMWALTVWGAHCKHSASLILLCILGDNFCSLARTRTFPETCANEMMEIRCSESKTSSLLWSTWVCSWSLLDSS